MMRGVERMNARDFAGAGALFDEVLAANPENDHVRDLIGACLIQLRQYDAAIPPHQTLIRNGRKRANTHFNLGLALYEVDRKGEAVAAFEDALALAPGEPMVLRRLIRVLRELDRELEATQYERQLPGQ